MTIVEIAEQIRARKDQDIEISERQDIFEWKPKECVDFTLPQFQIPDIRSKKYTNDRLSKVLAFIDLVQHKRIAHGCTIMPIASTNKRFMEICGGQKNASNLIQFMINIGLLEVENEYYQYNANHDRYNQSKQYKYYYDNERKIIQYCKENKIEKKILKNNKYIHILIPEHHSSIAILLIHRHLQSGCQQNHLQRFHSSYQGVHQGSHIQKSVP